jgi:hypothetical protein
MAVARQFPAAALPDGISHGDAHRAGSDRRHRVVAAARQCRRMVGAMGEAETLDRMNASMEAEPRFFVTDVVAPFAERLITGAWDAEDPGKNTKTQRREGKF